MKKITKEFLETLGIEESKILEILSEQEDNKFSFLGVLRGRKEHEKEVSDFRTNFPFFKTESSKHSKDLKKVGYEYKKVNDMYYFFILDNFTSFKVLPFGENQVAYNTVEKVDSSILEPAEKTDFEEMHKENLERIKKGNELIEKNNEALALELGKSVDELTYKDKEAKTRRLEKEIVIKVKKEEYDSKKDWTSKTVAFFDAQKKLDKILENALNYQKSLKSFPFSSGDIEIKLNNFYKVFAEMRKAGENETLIILEKYKMTTFTKLFKQSKESLNAMLEEVKQEVVVQEKNRQTLKKWYFELKELGVEKDDELLVQSKAVERDDIIKLGQLKRRMLLRKLGER